MTPLTLVMEADMLSLQLESSWHPDSETQQSEPPNPPGDRERGNEVKEEILVIYYTQLCYLALA